MTLVPWCSTCDRFLSPPTVTPDGSCPSCGRPVEPGRSHTPDGAAEPPPGSNGRAEGASSAEEEFAPVPLHMKILGASVVMYLGYRFLQGVGWVVHRF